MYHRAGKPAETSPHARKPVKSNRRPARTLGATTPDANEHYTVFFEQNPQPMWVFERHSLRFLAVNEAAIRLYGYSREEFLAQTIKEIRPPELIPKMMDFLVLSDQAETPAATFQAARWQHRKKDGTVFEVEAFWNRITFQGRDARMVIIRNLPSRRELEQNLGANEQLAQQRTSELQAIYQQAPIGLCFLDRDLRYVKINEHLARMNGHSVAEHIGRTVREMLPAIADRLEPLLQRVLETGEPVENLEFRESNPASPGFDFIGRLNYHPVRGARGDIIGINVAVVDITEHKRAEQALRDSQNRLRLIFSNIRDIAIFSLDLQGRITSWNPGAAKMFGYAEAEILGQDFAQIFTPEDRASGAPEMEIARARECDYSPDDRWHLRKDGSRLNVSGTVRPLRDERGAAAGFLKVARDITAHQRMQEQLEARLQQQAAVAHLGHLALAGGDEQSFMDQTTNLVTKTLGVEFAKILELLPEGREMLLRAGTGWKPGQVGHAHVGTGRESQAGYTLASDTPIISDDLCAEKHFKVLSLLEEHDVHSSVTVIIKGAQGQGPFGVLGACSTRAHEFKQDDVNFLQSVANTLSAALERKRFVQALGKSEEQFRELADAMPQIVWATRADGQPEYYNRRWFDFTGLSVEASMAPHGWQPVLHPDDVPVCQRTWTASLESGNPYEVECRYRNHQGNYRWFLIRAVPIKDEQGRVVRWFGSSTDIDDQKRANESLKKARERLRHHSEDLEKKVAERTNTLQESLQALEGVLYHVAHDLRAPLRAMQGLTTLLVEEYSPSFDAEGREYAGRIVSASSRMDVLIRDLLAYGRLGHVPLPAHRVDLEKIVKTAIDSLGEEIAAKDAQIQVQHPLTPVHANDTMLQQIVINLLSNALKFVAPGVAPRIRIWAETQGEKMLLSVQDNGIGISPEHHQRIFRVFERLHRTEEYPGTGIGLAIVTKGMERMGGRAGVESETDRGSRFWLELPTAPPAETP